MGFPNISKPKRSLGQNFFTNTNLGKYIVEKALETNPKRVIEIGPGRGFFTKLFVEKNIELFTIEKDDTLSKNLEFIFPGVEVFNNDFFDKDLLPLFQKNSNTVCFGSLPYNISKKIIRYLAQNSNIENFYFIIQKEVAEKYVSQKKQSILSLSTKLYFDGKIICDIAPENFKPRPNVISSFIKFSRNDNLKSIEDPENFLNYLHRAFKQPRKKLKNNLGKYYSPDNKILEFLDKRAEDFDLEEHSHIYENLKQKTI